MFLLMSTQVIQLCVIILVVHMKSCLIMIHLPRLMTGLVILLSSCMDDTMFNFIEPTGDNQVDVNTDDGSCYEVLVGCIDYDLDSLSNVFTGDVYLDINTNDDNLVVLILWHLILIL